MATHYTVRPDTYTEVVDADKIQLESRPCWSVSRVTDGFGWHIGKYATEAAAQDVAVALGAHIKDEVG